MKFRSRALNQLSPFDFETLVLQKEVFEQFWNGEGKRLPNRYKMIKQKGEKLIKDRATELTWQQSGSPNEMIYEEASGYITELNKQKFAGCKDWRLPTLDEAMSLMKPGKNPRNLHIESGFDSKQEWIWTADEADSEVVWWAVTFRIGYCYVPVDSAYYVRAVRGEIWVP